MQTLDRTLAALAHPIRRKVLTQLRAGEAPVKYLADAIKVSGPALTRHLHILENAGLILRNRVAQQRPCRLAPAPLRELDRWIATYRQFWAESFDRLDEHLKQVQRSKNKKRSK